MEPYEEVYPEFNEHEAQEIITRLKDLTDRKSKLKYLICNPAFNKAFKPFVVNEDGINAKVTLESVGWFTYIVTPYIKEKEKPTMYLTELDLNKICGVNSTYEGTILYIEDFLYNNIKGEWQATKVEETSNQPENPEANPTEEPTQQ